MILELFSNSGIFFNDFGIVFQQCGTAFSCGCYSRLPHVRRKIPPETKSRVILVIYRNTLNQRQYVLIILNSEGGIVEGGIAGGGIAGCDIFAYQVGGVKKC